jgi:hypothetical protein
MARTWIAAGMVAVLLLLEGCRGAAARRPTMPVPEDWGQAVAMGIFLLVLGLIIRRTFFS